MKRAGKRSEAGWLFHGGRILDARRTASSPKGRGAGRAGPAADRYPGAVLVRGDRIVDVGPLDRLRRIAGKGIRAVDLRGGTLTPGFVDAHIHLLTWIRSVSDVWLERQSPEGLEEAVRVASAQAADGGWVTIRGWVPREWPGELKRPSTLDQVLPDRPLVLFAIDGHSVWGNSVALQAAGLGAHTADPPGGTVDRDPGGALTGVLIEEAAPLLRRAVPRRREPAEDLARAIRKAHSLGITGAHDFDRTDIWTAAQELSERDRLTFRLLLSVPAARLGSAQALELRSGWGNDRVRIGPVKFFADGTLGSGTALLEEEYDDDTSMGTEVTSRAELEDRCVQARKAGLTVAIHAIGDRAVRNALDAIEAAIQSGGFPLPPRIEHIQLAREDDLPRFKGLGVLASVQPIHQVTDRAVARRKWGVRTARSYAYRSLQRAGAKLLFGSDAPFDRPGPLFALQAALLRRGGDEPDTEAFHPEQRVGLAQALRAHLEEPNRAAGWTTPLGRIEPGWGADLVQFDQDLLRIGHENLHHSEVRGVWVGGTQAYGGNSL
ncbi:MAG TPA: amidohydrolase [Candidatus Eisenbacteria bacterium]